MRRETRDRLTILDASGRRYPPGPLALAITETVVRSLLVVGVLCLFGLGWEAFA